MSMNTHIYRLTVLHRKLDDAVRRERGRRGGDPFRLLRLKKLKLAVKDRLAMLARRTAFWDGRIWNFCFPTGSARRSGSGPPSSALSSR
jgi:hypothetical protein